MTARRIHPHGVLADDALRAGVQALAQELELPGAFPPDVLAEIAGATAGGAAAMSSQLIGAGAREDATALPFVTLDPPGSRDLDQAFAIEPGGAGTTLLHYAIADVAAHVVAGGAVERESLARGATVYLPGHRIPLHPPELSEGVASLLPGERRLAVLWTITISDAGEIVGEVKVRRAEVRSTAQLEYVAAQEALDAGRPHPQIAALAALGPRLARAAQERGAIELPEPEQELVAAPGQGWTLAWVPRRPLEQWNAQLSLATGRAAAQLMLRSGRGILRTLPPAPPEAETAIRAAARALGIDWPADRSLPSVLAGMTGASAAELAFFEQCRTVLRGAGYLVLDGEPVHEQATLHAAVAAPYAHVTAPLRRLGDRFATEAALAAAAGEPVPAWAAGVLPGLPAILSAAGRRSGTASREIVDLAEAIVLQDRIGEQFDAAVVEAGDDGSEVEVDDPPVRARCIGPGLVAGQRARVELTVADPARRRVRFAAVPAPGAE